MRSHNRNLRRLNRTLRAIKWALIIIALVLLVHEIISILVTFCPWIFWAPSPIEVPSGQLAIF